MSQTFDAINTIWNDHTLPVDALQALQLQGCESVMQSTFSVDIAAQASIALAALAACQLGRTRGLSELPTVAVDRRHAAAECTGLFSIDGQIPPTWAPHSGLYRCRDGWLRVHANFDHHRDAALHSLQLPSLEHNRASREQLEQSLLNENAITVERRILNAGGAAAALRSHADWLAHSQAAALATLPLVEITRLGDGPTRLGGDAASCQPLRGVHVLDLTRILAGPVAGRTLAAYGAEVMLINSPQLPNIEAIADTSRGKLSAHIDLTTAAGTSTLDTLLKQTQVFIQGYRPGALAARKLDPTTLAERFPGIVYTTLSAYGRCGPWAARRGFDSLVQTATGFNDDEAQGFGEAIPRPMPVQILDYASGFLMAFGTSVALYKQLQHGGSWHVEVSLARTAQWLRSLGRNSITGTNTTFDASPYLRPYHSGWGKLMAIPHAAHINGATADWRHSAMPPGTHPAAWPHTN